MMGYLNLVDKFLIRARQALRRFSEQVILRQDCLDSMSPIRSLKGRYTADPPQRYTDNIEIYVGRGGAVDLDADIADFVKDSENNSTDMARFYMFRLICDQVDKEKILGDVVEVGVYKGNTAVLLARYCRRSDRKLYLLDTFEGFESEDLVGVDQDQEMEFDDTSLEAVKDFVGTESVVFVKGRFPETASELPVRRKYSIVHIDCDLYVPIIAALEYFYPRLVEGGFLMVHDYSSLWWPGAEQAVDEFFVDKPECIVPMPDISGTIVVRKARYPIVD
ncbi:TylF/MycF/NovP-related O-methyltransferase [Notoacmeibacter marinus]|uniref:TylF/MycF/NovP-related O-methyltransferase n=1 Tax=Notoacmeibacter marinus TaxID=1876515 RepID=UPI000DF35278|nr:TylF/MycF/NovP-related O-methyltransferase [Notoacmeibacter marinus]